MKPVTYSTDAEAELDNALAHSPDPDRFRDVLGAALNDIASGLMKHPPVGRTGCRECILPGLPFNVVYRETDDAIEVVAVSHHSRRPGHWKKRLRPN
ncbi:type II toxin-antitoxin system RelE/ParE family toxin [bacterium]|nr:type II toxin-antitoxin system RelE/ParE family toxin [bacterium]